MYIKIVSLWCNVKDDIIFYWPNMSFCIDWTKYDALSMYANNAHTEVVDPSYNHHNLMHYNVDGGYKIIPEANGWMTKNERSEQMRINKILNKCLNEWCYLGFLWKT